MDWTDLKKFCDVDLTNTSFDTRLQACWNFAGDLLTLKTAKAFRPIPQGTYDEMRLLVGKGEFDRRNSTAGGSQYGTYEGVVPARANRNPLEEVRSILAQYVVMF